MAYENQCVRCGHIQSDHIIVDWSDVSVEDLRNPAIIDGYKMDLFTCHETPAPKEYLKLLQDKGIYLGPGKAYISPDPIEEHKREMEEGSMAMQTHVIVTRNGVYHSE